MNRANMLVQNLLCVNCAEGLKKELSQIHNITHIYVSLKESAVWFNFVEANDISTLENQLTVLGFPPQGDKVNCHDVPVCFCNKSKNGFRIRRGMTNLE